MSRRQEHRDALGALPDPGTTAGREAWAAHLTAFSGLPGPRGNLELLAAFGDTAPRALATEFAGAKDEYLAACGTAALGTTPDAGALIVLKAAARDPRWRVREGVAMALQRIGDTDPALLRDVVMAWASDPDPLVARAAVAGICEPRLLQEPATAAAALDACASATAVLLALPRETRRGDAARTLRQGLGYCWSVAVAGSAGACTASPPWRPVPRTTRMWPGSSAPTAARVAFTSSLTRPEACQAYFSTRNATDSVTSSGVEP